MPSYTFRCPACGDFTLFFKSMSGSKEQIDCPACQQESMRVYAPPLVSTSSKGLMNRIERGMEPRRMTREQLGPNQTDKKPRIANRPWQVGN
ncbi:FmdB family zinc ribbon protein [Bacillus sp. FJAT-52991]|uniref:FmdB family zinc ribbon protein n=1 Tax=Bacillus kandeliae TaxID=3129297 RepID=A0ABZ2N2Q3_9BACI